METGESRERVFQGVGAGCGGREVGAAGAVRLCAIDVGVGGVAAGVRGGGG